MFLFFENLIFHQIMGAGLKILMAAGWAKPTFIYTEASCLPAA
jgi:hypothetical protein